MPERFAVDLSHFDFNSGAIGSLQTLCALPVVAGDGIELAMEGLFRLSPLRRNMVVDCQIDCFAFFVPHRHVYGQQWIDFIKEGVKENETFPTDTSPRGLSYLGSEILTGEVIPRLIVTGKQSI
jgi:hypothetical protein